MNKKLVLLVICMLIHITYISAKVTLPTILGDNMLLQQKENVKIWGKSTAIDKEIVVWCGWDKKTYTSSIDKNGDWKVLVKTPKFGGPYEMTIDDGDKLTLRNVLIGDVWFCSGQSNMEMPLAGWGQIINYKDEINNANFPNIRILQAIKNTSNLPIDKVEVASDGWNTVSPKTISNFSATAYFFAKEIYENTGVPIGLIHSSWGGTIIESWISKDGLKAFSKYANTIERISHPKAQELYQKDLVTWNARANQDDEIYRKNNGKWFLHTDFSTWTSIKVPSFFDSKLYPSLDGVVYYAKTVSIPSNWQKKPLKLIMGAIDDNDVTYVNRVKVGETEGYNRNRVYDISPEINSEDKLTIMIRVYDGAGEGGMYGGGELPRLENAAGQSIPLTGDWSIKVGYDLHKLPARPVAMDGPNRPTVLYNAMVHPFLDFTIKGVIWYQGESNAESKENAILYKSLLPALISNWREKWNKPNMPFYFAQLANFREKSNYDDNSLWAVLRHAQYETLKVHNSGMAVLADVGDAVDIHPKNKQEVGRRLGLIARSKIYNQKNDYAGPGVLKYQKNKNSVILTMDVNAKKMKLKNVENTSSFYISGKDNVYYPATVKVLKNTLVLTSDKVANPTSVRYAWSDNPNLLIYNTSGLPSSPFQIDL